MTYQQWHDLFVAEIKLWFEEQAYDFPEISVFRGQVQPGFDFFGDGQYHVYFMPEQRDTLSTAQKLLDEITRCVVNYDYHGTNFDVLRVLRRADDHNILTHIIDRIGPYPEK